MGLATQPLYDMALVEIGGGVGNSRFSAAFVNATNMALNELSDELDLDDRFDEIAAVNSTISNMPSNRSYILYSGVLYYLMRMGQRPTDPKVATVIYNDTAQRWKEGKGNYWMKIQNDNQAVETNDVTKLGSVVS